MSQRKRLVDKFDASGSPAKQPRLAIPSERSTELRPDAPGTEEKKSLVTKLSRKDVAMLLALWYEKYPSAQNAADESNLVGVTVVAEEPNDIFVGSSYTCRAHAVAKLFQQNDVPLKNSTVFCSRKPCDYCLKLLVQKEVKSVKYYPSEPEDPDLVSQEVSDLLLSRNSTSIRKLSNLSNTCVPTSNHL